MTTPSSKPRLIGLTGYQDSGKSTAASILNVMHGFEPVSLTEPIDGLLYRQDPLVWGDKSLIPLVDEYGWGGASTHRVYGSEITQLRQATGDALLDLFGQDFLLEPARERSQSLLAEGTSVVIPDVRREQEAAMVRQMGGVLWRVERLNHRPGRLNAHPTEEPIEVVDDTLTTTLDDRGSALAQQIESILGRDAR